MMVRNPSNIAGVLPEPCMVKTDGLSSNTEPTLLPLSIVIRSMSVTVPVPPIIALAAPVNLIAAVAALPLLLKSSMPLLMRFPPATSSWPVSVPVSEVRNVAPGLMRISELTVRVTLPVDWNLSNPPEPCPTVNPSTVAFTSMTTLAPSAIITWSVGVGRLAPTHVAGSLQFPPVVVDTTWDREIRLTDNANARSVNIFLMTGS